MTLKNFLIKNKANSKLLEYAKDMTLTEFYNNCNRGDWIIWLFSKTNPHNSYALVLVAAHCANACRDLLEDERSLKAIDAAMNFESYSEKELREISNAAYAEADVANTAAGRAAYAADVAAYAAAGRAAYAAYAADAAARATRIAADAAARATRADAAARATRAAADAANTAADVAWSAAYYAAAAYANAAAAYAACAGADVANAQTANALRDNKLIADIVRKHLPLEIWNQQSIINN